MVGSTKASSRRKSQPCGCLPTSRAEDYFPSPRFLAINATNMDTKLMPKTAKPMYAIVTSSIGFSTQSERPQAENRRNPDANKNSLILASRKPQIDRQQKGNRGRSHKSHLRKLK